MVDEIEPPGGQAAPPAADAQAPAQTPAQAAGQVDEQAVEAGADEPPASAQPRPEPPPATGLPGVDGAVERLGSLAELPVDEHVAVFDEVQRRLHDALAELDDEQ